MIEIIKAFDPESNLDLPVHRNQRVIKKESLQRIRKEMKMKHSVKHVLFITKELEKEA